MSLRRRIALLSAAAVAIAVALGAGVAYVAVRAELLKEVDDALTGQARFVADRAPLALARPGRAALPAPPPRRGGPIAYAQLVSTGGGVVLLGGARLMLPVTPAVRSAAATRTGRFFTDASVNGSRLRVLTVGSADGALQLARPLDGTDSVLRRLRLILAAVCLIGIALAAGFGRLAARRVTGPIRELTATARHISRTQDLGRRIATARRDEVGELAAEFDAMLATLQASQCALDAATAEQRQLVADASHELRTPVTALRTNVELLEEGALGPADRAAVLADLRGQAEELGALVADIIELARGAEPVSAREEIRLDELVREAVSRARAYAPATRFTLHAEPVTVEGVPDRLGRAVNNLLDNAVQHGAGAVEVVVDAHGVAVRDGGPGFLDEDLPHVFDRFYRSTATRGRPGTGLGLAIVRQVADTHGGSVEARNAPGGGAELRLRLPASPLALVAG